jgi:hypothetical protein
MGLGRGENSNAVRDDGGGAARRRWFDRAAAPINTYDTNRLRTISSSVVGSISWRPRPPTGPACSAPGRRAGRPARPPYDCAVAAASTRARRSAPRRRRPVGLRLAPHVQSLKARSDQFPEGARMSIRRSHSHSQPRFRGELFPGSVVPDHLAGCGDCLSPLGGNVCHEPSYPR